MSARHKTIAVSLLLAFALCGVSTPGFAQSDVVQRAKALVSEGDELYEARQFEAAASKYAAAYELVPDPVLIGTESVTWYKAGDCSKSLRLVDEFAGTQEPGSPLPSQLQEVQVGCALRAAGAALAAGDYDAAQAALGQAATVGEPSERQRERMQNLEREIEVARADAERPDDSKARSAMTSRSKLGWALVGTGAVVAASSIVTYLGHQRHLEEYDDLTGTACSGDVDGRFAMCDFESDEEYATAQDTHRRVVTNAVATYALVGTGAALSAVGAILLITKPKERPKLLVGPTSIGVGFTF